MQQSDHGGTCCAYLLTGHQNKKTHTKIHTTAIIIITISSHSSTGGHVLSHQSSGPAGVRHFAS